jgi:hypothetical protein
MTGPAPRSCPRCGENPVDENGRPTLLLFPLVVLGVWPPAPALCRDCAGGLHLLGLLAWAVVVAGAVALAIMMLFG